MSTKMFDQPIDCLKEKGKELEGKIKALEDKIKEEQRELTSEKIDSDEYTNRLEEKRKEIEKIRGEKSFMPCELKRKAHELHKLLLCYRKLHVCVLQKKQRVSMLTDQVELFGVQSKRASEQLKKIQDGLKSFGKIIDAHYERVAQEKLLQKISEDAKLLIAYYAVDKPCTGDELSDEKFSIFKKAKERIEKDFPGKFLEQARRRRNILRQYDEGKCKSAKTLLVKLKLALGDHKAIFEKAEKEYKTSLDAAQANYANAMKLMGEIVKSKEITSAEQSCIKECSSCSSKRNSALECEKLLYSCFRDKNNKLIDSQCTAIDNLCKSRAVALTKELEEEEKSLQRKKEECNACYNILDCWEASVPEHIWDNFIKYEKAFELFYEVILTKAEFPVSEIRDVSPSFYLRTIQEKKDCVEAALSSWIGAWSQQTLCQLPNMPTCVKDYLNDAAMILERQIIYAEKNKEERVRVALQGESNTFLGEELYNIIPTTMPCPCIPSYSPINSPSSGNLIFCSQQSALCSCEGNIDVDFCVHAAAACVQQAAQQQGQNADTVQEDFSSIA